MAKLGLSEILEQTSQQPEGERGEFLRRNWNPTLGQLIRYAYDSVFKWNLPAGDPPYTPNEYLDQESNLYNETRRLYVFMEGSGDHVPQARKELLFIQLLESLSKADAKLLVDIKEGRLPYGITEEFIIKELPGQLVSPRSEVEQPQPVFPETSDTADESVEDPVVEDGPTDEPTPAKKPATKRKTKRKTAVKKPVARKAKTGDK
jgi:hypothetical protein